jgi:hypothetical protein
MLAPHRFGWPLAVALVFRAVSPLAAQNLWMGERTFTAYRPVQLSATGNHPTIVVTEFLTQGQVRGDGANLLVVDGHFRPVARRILQVGPGDFCRVAFRTARGQNSYRVYYGGTVSEVKQLEWTHGPGLLLETRRWKECDLNRLDAVREAFQTAEPVGADYVSAAGFRYNPFDPNPEPFLSRYRGTLRLATGGSYVFYTSSQDCSFLLIDGKAVVSSPGRHGAVGDARVRGSANLAPGDHAFEYVHAAAGPDATLVAAWLPPGAARPELVPAQAFDGAAIAHLPAGSPRHCVRGALADFTATITGDAPVLESDAPLVRVQFKDVSAHGRYDRFQWDFGDGQASEKAEPVHVYLRPGLYTVTLTVHNGTGTHTAVNRVFVHRPAIGADGVSHPDRLADYLPVVVMYNPTRMDYGDVLQFARALEQSGQLARAAVSARAALVDGRPRPDEETILTLARLAGPWLRDQLDDPAGAVAAWQGAARAARSTAHRLECEVEAADVCLHELLNRARTKELLDAAADHLAGAPSELVARYHRVQGDWHARGGDGVAARAAYNRAAALRGSTDGVEQEARRGAFSRSAEAFLREKELGRALDELRAWQDRFPADRAAGYLPLLQARHRVARGQYAQAAALAADLLAVNRDSPHADQLAFLAAECEEKMGHADRAAAAWRAFLTDHPGSPLVPDVRKKLAAFADGPKK